MDSLSRRNFIAAAGAAGLGAQTLAVASGATAAGAAKIAGTGRSPIVDHNAPDLAGPDDAIAKIARVLEILHERPHASPADVHMACDVLAPMLAPFYLGKFASHHHDMIVDSPLNLANMVRADESLELACQMTPRLTVDITEAARRKIERVSYDEAVPPAALNVPFARLPANFFIKGGLLNLAQFMARSAASLSEEFESMLQEWQDGVTKAAGKYVKLRATPYARSPVIVELARSSHKMTEVYLTSYVVIRHG